MFSKIGCFSLIIIGVAIIVFFVLTPAGDSNREKTLSVLRERLVADNNREVRGTTARSLGRIGDKSAIRALLLAYQKDGTIMTEVVDAFIDMNVKPSDLQANPPERNWLHDALLAAKGFLLTLNLSAVGVYLVCWSL